MMRLKKGSREARAYMARIRSMRGKNPRRTGTLSALRSEAGAVGLSMDSYSPGDGVTRYRFFPFPNGDYFAHSHQAVGTVKGLKAAFKFVARYAKNPGVNPLTAKETKEIWGGVLQDGDLSDAFKGTPAGSFYKGRHTRGREIALKYHENPAMLVMGANPPSGPADPDAARELDLFISSDGDLYRQQYQSIIANLMRKRAAGKYDREKAVVLFMYLMDAGARKYTDQFGTPGAPIDQIFNRNTRLEVAREFRNRFETEVDLGNYDLYIPKKYRKNPLTPEEAERSLGYAKSSLRMARKAPKGEYRSYHAGSAFGQAVVVHDRGGPDYYPSSRRLMAEAEKEGFLHGSLREENPSMLVMGANPKGSKKSIFWHDGFNAGVQAAKDNFSTPPGRAEMMGGDLGRIAGEIREHQVQFAGDVAENLSESQLSKWEDGFYSGFETEGRRLASQGNPPPTLRAQKFISKKIKKLVREGYPIHQAQAIAYSKARRKGYRSVPRRRRNHHHSAHGVPAHIARDPRFQAELRAYRKRHGRGPIRVTKIKVPKGFPKYMSAWGTAPAVLYDASDKSSNKGKRIHKFGEKGGKKPFLVSSVQRGKKFLAYAGGRFRANGEWIYD